MAVVIGALLVTHGELAAYFVCFDVRPCRLLFTTYTKQEWKR